MKNTIEKTLGLQLLEKYCFTFTKNNVMFDNKDNYYSLKLENIKEVRKKDKNGNVKINLKSGGFVKIGKAIAVSL